MAATAVYTRSERVGQDFGHVPIGSENKLKRKRQKTVTWPTDEQICEVRSFLVDDAPSALGTYVRENLQSKYENAFPNGSKLQVLGAKRARMEHDNDSVDVPPGFGHLSRVGKSPQPKDAVMAIRIPWHHPHKFLDNAAWLWAGGEESLEVASEQQREKRCFEAFYPRWTSIPDSPSEPQEPSKKVDDALVARIPLVSLEEEEVENEEFEQESIAMPSGDIVHRVPTKQQQDSTMSVADLDMAAAAAEICMMVKALGKHDLIDQKLLLEILKNPSLLKTLTCSDNSSSKSQDQVSSTTSMHREPQRHKVPSAHGAHLLKSPVSVPTQWDDFGSISNRHRMAVISNRGAHMQQSTNASMNPVLPTNLPALYPCSNPELSTYIPVECKPRIQKKLTEIFKTNLSTQPNLYDVYRPRDGMGSQYGSSEDPHTSSMQTSMTRSPQVSVHSSSLRTRDLPNRISMQPKCRSLLRKTNANTRPSKTGGRAKSFCMYFNSPRGCRNGESCAFVHETLYSAMNTMA